MTVTSVGQLPAPDKVPDGLRQQIEEYRKIETQMLAAQQKLSVLRGSVEQARLDDAQALSDAARAERDLTKVGTPAQDRLAKETSQQATIVAGLERAHREIGIEIESSMRTASPAAIAMAKQDVERLREPYLAAIAAVEQAAAAFDAGLYLVSGWLTFAQSEGKRVGFASQGSLNINGSWFDPFNLPALTHAMREHVARYDKLVTALDVATAPPAQAKPLGRRRTREESFDDDGAAVWAA